MRADELFRIQHDKLTVSEGARRSSYESAVGLVVLRQLEVTLGPAFNNKLPGDLAHNNGPLGGGEQVEDLADWYSEFTTVIFCIHVEGEEEILPHLCTILVLELELSPAEFAL